MKRASLRCHRCYSGFLYRQNDRLVSRERRSSIRAIGRLAHPPRQFAFPSRYPEESKIVETSSARRFLTSVVNEEDVSDDVMSRVQVLLDAKHFHINEPAIWEEVEEILQLLTLKATAKKNAKSMEEVEYAIRLLDKLANSLPQDQVVFASILETDVLNRILAIWNRRMKALGGKQPLKTKKNPRRPNRVAKNRDRMLSPDVMAERIDRYRWCSLVQPDHKTFSFVLDSASSLETTPVFADELLEKLLQVSEATPSQVLIDTASICIVMKAWSQSGRPDKAADWFRRMQKLYQRQGWEEVRPNKIAYTTVIHGWSQKEDKADEAEALLKEQLEDFQAGNEDCQPDTRTFNAVLNAISKSNRGSGDKSLDRCKAILHQMQDLSSNAGWKCAPDQYSLTSMILCCTTTVGPDEAEKLLAELLETMSIAPSVVPYNVILRGYAKRGNGVDAEALLARLKEMDGVIPDETSYNTVLHAWSQSKDPKAPQKAETLLWEMQDDTTNISPSVVSFGSVLQCWTQHAQTSKEAAIQGEELLRQMQQEFKIAPNIICYNTVLNAWVTVARKFGAPEALERASILLQELLALHEKKNSSSTSSSLRPTMVTFRTMLYLIAESKQVSNKADRARAVVRLMEQYKVKGNKSDEKIIQRLLKSGNETTTRAIV
ncbi:unnamed protein product [Cylindrotheca closterium]|uniref:Pentacotripeptide-repeat region of PRORP domain-containing protein n=1 Tax=Cylindrotheca closterium TaxID=2856 RepID=A0AAD2FRW3_9STRA|nr:unnamed protein product [Cylindrotheca closterium]